MKLRVPHTYVLLFILLLIAAASTYFIPAGEYDRLEHNGRLVVDPQSYHRVDARPAGVVEIFMAFPRGLMEVAHIVFYIFIVGGAFGVVTATGAVEAGIGVAVRAVGQRDMLLIPGLTLLFSLGGGTFGMAEETLPFLPALVLLARSLGYDSLTAGGIALVGACAGFGGAFINPFTLGVAQGIAELPPLSGMPYRIMTWSVLTAITVWWMMRYARRIKKNPQASPAYAIDQLRAKEHSTSGKLPQFTRKHGVVLLLSIFSFTLLIVGAMRWEWGIMELSGLFVAMTIFAGPLGGLSLDKTAEKFIEGAASLTGGALVVGLARATLVVLNDARVIDTIIAGMAGAVQHLPASVSVVGIYAMQILLSYIVPSGGGQAALSIPILAPLADLLGVTRQTMVLAYQFGDGFSNIMTPAQGYFMAGLALIGVPWSVWARWFLPLLGIWYVIGLVLLLIAHAIKWGPF
jgi:uncharacterized ion transporter superfamily protein YfcC